MSKSLSKKELIDELAEFSELRKTEVAELLDKLAEIAFREARNGFTIPSICKLKVVRKKASKCRNPATGELLLVGEHDVVKVIPLKKAKDSIAPRNDDLVEVIKYEPRAKPAPAPAPASVSASIGDAASDGVVFACDACGATISASASLAGQKGQCPYCEMQIIIPTREQARQKMAKFQPVVQEQPDQEATEIPRDDFFTLVCQVCGQEIEAPTSMIGQEANCPACESPITVVLSAGQENPEDGKEGKGKEGYSFTNTMRIDLSELGL